MSSFDQDVTCPYSILDKLIVFTIPQGSLVLPWYKTFWGRQSVLFSLESHERTKKHVYKIHVHVNIVKSQGTSYWALKINQSALYLFLHSASYMYEDFNYYCSCITAITMWLRHNKWETCNALHTSCLDSGDNRLAFWQAVLLEETMMTPHPKQLCAYPKVNLW